MLAAILSGGESSRMHQRLVRKDHLAIAAGGVTESMEYPGLFIVYAALPARSRSRARCRRRCSTRFARVRDQAGDARTSWSRRRTSSPPAYIFGLQTVDGIAQQLGQYQYVYGDWREFSKGASRYLAVTAADVKRVAAKYLVDTNLTLVTLQPPPGRAGAAPAKGGAK